MGYCKRFSGKIDLSPGAWSNIFKGVNWILQPGLVVSVSVFRAGQVGRYLRLGALSWPAPEPGLQGQRMPRLAAPYTELPTGHESSQHRSTRRTSPCRRPGGQQPTACPIAHSNSVTQYLP